VGRRAPPLRPMGITVGANRLAIKVASISGVCA
jgi:hypothetical protein